MPLGYTREQCDFVYKKNIDKLKMFDLSNIEYLTKVYICIDIEKKIDINTIRLKYKLKYLNN